MAAERIQAAAIAGVRRRNVKPASPNPLTIIAQAVGSGTKETVNVAAGKLEPK